MEITKDLEELHIAAQFRMAQLGKYYDWVLSNFGAFVGERIWDASAGIGIIVDRLLASGAQFVLASELTDQNLESLHEKYNSNPKVKVSKCDLLTSDSQEFKSQKIDTIINLDVLEHIEDDLTVLKNFHDVLVPGGNLLIKVPSHPWLFGTIDEISPSL